MAPPPRPGSKVRIPVPRSDDRRLRPRWCASVCDEQLLFYFQRVAADREKVDVALTGHLPTQRDQPALVSGVQILSQNLPRLSGDRPGQARYFRMDHRGGLVASHLAVLVCCRPPYTLTPHCQVGPLHPFLTPGGLLSIRQVTWAMSAITPSLRFRHAGHLPFVCVRTNERPKEEQEMKVPSCTRSNDRIPSFVSFAGIASQRADGRPKQAARQRFSIGDRMGRSLW